MLGGVDFIVGRGTGRPGTQSGKATSKFYEIWIYEVFDKHLIIWELGFKWDKRREGEGRAAH